MRTAILPVLLSHRRVRNPLSAAQVVLFLCLCIGFVMIAYPMFWIIMSSLKTSREITTEIWSLPTTPLWRNYVIAWRSGISQYFLNSMIVTISTILGVIVVASLAGYGLSRYRMLWTNLVLIPIMGGMMLNPQVCLIPLYRILTNLGIRNTLLALIVPYIAFRLPMHTLIIRSFFLAIPREIEESALMDGCTGFQIYGHIFVPMSRPILVTSAILTSYYAWNEFMFALIFIDSNRYRTIPAGLMNFRDALQVDYGPLLAGMVISALPIMIFFISVQKYFVRGLLAGSVKG
ncbi:ABC transporter permease [Alkalispirochaeta sphaeroplastigenens]|uniref:sn-glycerol-3-phosphate transport system permease protein UgpE n=1 Tax=Alkalispirochaeta sphaeroplastigenens TaxID=1187066 RepID=A0A2S4JVK6_9SPIO|nr:MULTISPECIES: carbohydrate ABC transporter permease [Alkalispirochaeta]POR03552.1 ABC transporter permease [Alkalispirochaeta sphaeroplastigenens]